MLYPVLLSVLRTDVVLPLDPAAIARAFLGAPARVEAAIQLLIDNPLLLLFVVAAIGYPLGQVSIRGSRLGVAAVLFAGLGVGALHPDLRLPEVIYSLGLVLFVYTIGLSSGPGFFRSLNRTGLKYNLLVLAMTLLAASTAVAAHFLLGLSAPVTAGLFAGSLTNTPALAGVMEYLREYAVGPADQLLNEPVIGYSITYPMGVVATILAIGLSQRLWRVDYAAEAESLPQFATTRRLSARTVCVTQPRAVGKAIREMIKGERWDVVFARMRRSDRMSLVDGDTRLALGDQVSVVGPVEELARVTAALGEECEPRLDLDRSEFDYRRIFVSNPQVAGRRIRDLDLQGRLGAVVTRVRRGDFDLLPHGDTVLELGDRVRVLTHRSRMAGVTSYFGDSYRALSEIDILTFSLGLALGLIVGSIPIPLPGDITFRLGFAGGPLIVALILGTIGHSGPLVWSLPYSANLTLRQIGLVLFLAGIGTRAGFAFVTTLTQGGGLAIFLAGIAVTSVAAMGTLWVGYRLLHVPMGLLIGMLSGLQTQPAVLGFSLEQTRNDLPNIGYSTVYPMAMILKILVAQVLLVMLL